MSRNPYFARIACAFLVCVFQSFNLLNAAPGATPGDGGVTATGAATYSIPIRIPEGVNGMQPNIALAYHSRTGSGHAGVGWNLTGIPEIRRCGQVYATHGKQTGVSLTSQDRFCLNGEMLVSGTGTYGANNATYYTEVESYAKVTSFTSGGAGSAPASGPQWFKVETPDGLVYEYGKTTDSRLETVGTTVPLVWAVNRITDPNGNYIDFTYLEYTDKGAHYPREIKYTGTASAAPIYSIYFTWPLKPSAERTTHYVAGTSQRIERRLGTIELRHNGSEFRRYNLGYESATSPSGLSRLASVQECVGSDCLPATQIEWNALAAGMSAPAQQTITNKLLNARLMDIDGDGRKDLVYDSGGTWWIMFATALPGQGISFGSAVNTGIQAINPDTAVAVDFNGDGRGDLMYRGTGNKWYVLRSNGTGFGEEAYDTQTTLGYHGGSIWVTDIDGDGRDDVVYARETIEAHWYPRCEPGVPCYYNTGYVEIFYRLNTGAGFGAEVKAQHIDNKTLSPVAFPEHWRYKSTSATPDFNGDGIADLMILLSPVPDPNCVNCTDPNFWTWHPMTIHTGGFNAVSGLGLLPYNASPLVLDFNGDGNSDLAYADTAVNKWKVYVSNGAGFGTPVTTDLPRNAYVDKAVALDYDNDGRDDIVLPDAGYWKVARSTGTNFTTMASLGISWQVDQFARVADFDGDGDGDLLMLRPYGSTLYWRRARNIGEYGDKVVEVRDGLGNEVRFSYGSSADADLHAPLSHGDSINYTRLNNALSLVSEMSKSDGNGGVYPVTYSYYKGRRDRQGRGFQGFDRRYVTDMRNNKHVIEYYGTAFPFTGVPMKRHEKRFVPIGSTAFHAAVYENEDDLFFDPPEAEERDSGNEEFAVATLSGYELKNAHLVDYTYTSGKSPWTSAGKAINLAEKKEVRYFQIGAEHNYNYKTFYSNYDSWGNPTTIVHERFSSAANFPSISISNTYQNAQGTRYCATQLVSSEVTYKSKDVPNIVEKTNQTWDNKCRVTKQTRESGTAHEAFTQYGYDTFGNVTSITVGGANVSNRQTQLVYDALGYRPVATVNALNQTVLTGWDTELRNIVSASDLDGNLTHFEYDNFGRLTRATLPDGSYRQVAIAACGSQCGSSSVHKLKVTETITGGSVSGGAREIWLDSHGRPRYLEQSLLGGLKSKQLIEYDALGQVQSRSMPYSGNVPSAYVHYEYDDLGRPLRIEMPGENGGPPREVYYDYVYVSNTVHYTEFTDAEGNKTRQYFDAIGRPSRVLNAAGHNLHYAYDAAGRLVRTTDPSGNTVQIDYNVLGHRVSLNDPNLGSWTFTPNVFGELVSQTDAKNQTTSFTYDALGRLKTRVEGGVTSTWYYDAASGSGKGKLHKIVAPGYTEEYAYDTLGRPVEQKLAFDGSNYQYEFEYDAFSRLSRLIYPQSVSTAQGDRFAVDYAYDVSGALQSVRNANDANEIFWQASDMNAFGQVTTAILGNDVTSIKEFDAHTGRLKTLRSFAQGQPELWNLNYEYSPAGNIEARENTVANLRETFTYDNLHRLKTYSLNGSQKQSLGYNAIGNITSKTGVGSYTYDSARPHAVIATSTGSISYQYDANGNMTQRGNTRITWNAANLPTQIAQGGDTLSFHYGPTRQRYKQTATIGGQSIVTHYVGGLMEAIGGNGVVQYRHRIVAAGEVVAQHTRDSNIAGGNPKTVYTQTDMLGSIGLITDENGNVIGKMHFDPWGKRLNEETWNGNPTSGQLTALRNITHRGFTDHEMLDSMNLVHMNGRVYDPNLARMLSADPINSNPANLQRYNRYSYVLNNPLGLIDPTGLTEEIKFDVPVYWRCNNDSCWGGSSGPEEDSEKLPRVIIPAPSGSRSARSNYEDQMRRDLQRWAGQTREGAGRRAGEQARGANGVQRAPTERRDLGVVGNLIRDQLDSEEAKDLFENYWEGGGDIVLSDGEFHALVNADGLQRGEFSVLLSIGDGTYEAASVSFYGNDQYRLAYGTATVYFDTSGKPVGFYDSYDFDWQWGGRSLRNEIITRAVGISAFLFSRQARPFEICYGLGCKE